MKLKRKITALTLSFLLILGVIVFSIKKLETTTSQYESYSEISPDTFEAGWIPKWLPNSAVDIKESHNIDNNVSWIIFTFSAADAFYSACLNLPMDNVVLPNIGSDKGFPNFVGEIINQVNENKKLSFFSCDENKNRFLAIDNEMNKGYVWTNAS